MQKIFRHSDYKDEMGSDDVIEWSGMSVAVTELPPHSSEFNPVELHFVGFLICILSTLLVFSIDCGHFSETSKQMPVQTFQDLLNFRKHHQKNICVGHINVNSLRKEDDRPLLTLKRDYLCKLKLDFLCVQEAKLDRSTQDKELTTAGYRIFREGFRKHGGSCIFVKENIPVSRIPIKSSGRKFEAIECIALHVVTTDCNFVLLSIYRRPSKSLLLAKEEIMKLLTLCSSVESELMVIGDLNLCAIGTHNTNHTSLLEDICAQFNIDCHVNQVTRPDSAACLDLVLAATDFISGIAVHDPDLSDHYMVLAALVCNRRMDSKKTFMCRSFKYFDPDKFLEDVSTALPVFGVGNIFDDVDNKHHFFNSLYVEILDQHAPWKEVTIKANSHPWFNSELAHARRQKHVWLNRTPFDTSGKRIKDSYAWKQKIFWQKIEKQLNRKNAKEYFQMKCESENPKDFYRTFGVYFQSKKTFDQTKIMLVDTVNNECCIEDHQVHEKFGKYFQSLMMDDRTDADINKSSNFDDHLSIKLIEDCTEKKEAFEFSRISPSEVEKIIQKKVHCSKSTGYDGIPPRAIKSSAPIFSILLASLFNSMTSSCTFPSALKCGSWSPVFKGGNRTELSRYRPITVLTQTAKLLESLMTKQFSKYILPSMSPFQFAYKANHNTEAALLYMTESWKKDIDSRQCVGILSLDLSKAFDSINHDLLLRKLKSYGMSDSALSLMSSYLTCRQNCMRVNGKYSKQWYPINRGIPQGSQWGPLIWNTFINDFILFIKSHQLQIVAYADDMTLWTVGNSSESVQQKLTSVVPLILAWFKANYLQVNPSKFQFMALGRDSEKILIKINDVEMQSQDKIKLLGVTIDRKFQYDYHVKKVTRTIAWKLCGINRLKRMVDKKVRWRLIQTYIMPHFEYSSSLLVFSSAASKKKLESMYERCMRHATRDYNSPLHELHVKLKVPSLSEKWHLSLFRFMQSTENTMKKRKTQAESTFLSKCQFLPGFSSVVFLDMFSESPDGARRNVFHQPKFNTKTYGHNSIRYYGASFWNKIPQESRQHSHKSDTALHAIRKHLQKQSSITN